MRPDIREQSLPRRTKTGVLAIGEGSIYGRLFLFSAVWAVPVILATSLRRRLLVYRGLGSRDINPVPD